MNRRDFIGKGKLDKPVRPPHIKGWRVVSITPYSKFNEWLFCVFENEKGDQTFMEYDGERWFNSVTPEIQGDIDRGALETLNSEEKSE